MAKVMISLPDSLIERMKASIPTGERSHVLAELLEKEIEARESQLYARALELESNKELRTEMQAWDQTFGNDGLDNV